MMDLKNVSYTYPNGNKALDNVNLRIEHGEKVFIGGLTGTGKSTLLRIFNGLIPFFYGGKLEGKVSIYSSSTPEEIVSNVFFVSQHPEEQIIANRVADEIAFSLVQRGMNWEDVEDEVVNAAKLCGIEHLLDRRTSELSEGEKQMVVIASAIASDAKCIVLDEPFAHLHPSITEEILRKLLKTDKTVVASEHRIELSSAFEREIWVGDVAHFDEPDVDSSIEDRVVVEADSLSFGYGDRLLFEDLSFEFFEGGIYAITGLNGAGKTTLLKMIAGLVKPLDGTLKVRGKVSMAFQYPNYHFSENNVEREVGKDLLEMFDLTHLSKRHPHSLSGGEAKRVSIAKAFRGDIVLLDEPTAGQDYLFRKKLIEVARRSRKTVIMATHDLKLASLCDGVIELDAKKNSFDG